MLTLHNLRKEIEPILDYINNKWNELTGNARRGYHDAFDSWKDLAKTSIDGHLGDNDHDNPYILYLPNDYIYPGGRFVVQFYWDSYFIILQIISSKFTLAKGMVDNCLFSVDKHGMVIANRKRWAAGSQLPFLSAMVREIYQIQPDNDWLNRSVEILEKEYNNYWLNENHLFHRGLSRYHAPPCFPKEHIPEITLDNEATWDMSPRFESEDILHLLPIDLNSNLFMYEKNFEYYYEQLGQKSESKIWKDRAQKRKETINELMWDEEDGIYYDYNCVKGERKKIKSLAAYFPLYHNLAEKLQADKLRNNLILFEKDYGLATCDQDYGYSDRQWNYPIGWAPLHWIVYQGLIKYGYKSEAERIALKWLNLIFSIWKETNKLFEKYDVCKGTYNINKDKRYKNQEGFGWTNAVFKLLMSDMIKKRNYTVC